MKNNINEHCLLPALVISIICTLAFAMENDIKGVQIMTGWSLSIIIAIFSVAYINDRL